jgi:hypothetical protein
MLAGIKRIWSVIATQTVRFAFLGSAARPKAVSSAFE